uniref:Uncharacterized protein n=1 Tax=Rhizophora mucronata TaxID=61149 RepID=A0A2P2MBP1_RHIMU
MVDIRVVFPLTTLVQGAINGWQLRFI